MAYDSWKKYESAERWTSYYTQVDEVLHFQGKTCLEVGVGNGIVSDALKRQGLDVITLDIDPALAPDVVGSVERILLPDVSVDVSLCAEVLEHLPFEKFEACIKELARVSRLGLVLSLPHWGYTSRVILDLPGLPPLRAAWKLPIKKILSPGGVHFWEIGRADYPLSRITKILRQHFSLEKDWLSPWMPYHHFFRLRKRPL